MGSIGTDLRTKLRMGLGAMGLCMAIGVVPVWDIDVDLAIEQAERVPLRPGRAVGKDEGGRQNGDKKHSPGQQDCHALCASRTGSQTARRR